MINIFETVNAVIVVLGVPTILGAAIYIGRKLQILDDLSDSGKKIDEELKSIKRNIEELNYGHIENKSTISALKIHTNYGVTNSPTQPNEKGKKLLADSHFQEVYLSIRDDIFTKMDERKLRTLYDVEQASFSVLRSFGDDPRLDPLKDYAVNNPAEPLDLILLVGSWIVRDEYWEKLQEKQVIHS